MRRLVTRLQPFAGMCHLDVAGGTGDVAFRVLREMREDQLRQQERSDSPSLVQLGQVHVCDINPDMLQEGKRKAQQQRLGTFTWVPPQCVYNSKVLITLGHLKLLVYVIPALICGQEIFDRISRTYCGVQKRKVALVGWWAMQSSFPFRMTAWMLTQSLLASAMSPTSMLHWRKHSGYAASPTLESKDLHVLHTGLDAGS